MAADSGGSDEKSQLLVDEADVEEATAALAVDPTEPVEGVQGAGEATATTTRPNFHAVASITDYVERDTEDTQHDEQPGTTAEKSDGSTVEVVVRDNTGGLAVGAPRDVAEASVPGSATKRLR